MEKLAAPAFFRCRITCLVPRKGLEPPRLAALVPEHCVIWLNHAGFRGFQFRKHCNRHAPEAPVFGPRIGIAEIIFPLAAV